MVSAEKSGQYSVSAVESLLFCITNLVTRNGSADTYQPIKNGYEILFWHQVFF